MEAAAGALLRLTRRPTGHAVWHDFQTAFWERYGTGVLVPLSEVLDPAAGLGFPAEYPGSVMSAPATLTSERDGRLLALAWQAVADGSREVVLTDDMIDAIAGNGPTAGPPHVEMCARIHAEDVAALGRGDFTLTVTPARSAGTLTSRFTPAAGGSGLEEVYRTIPPGVAGALPAQLSFPPLYPHTENVCRIPAYLPHVISLGEHRGPEEDVTTIPLNDLAITATHSCLHLVSVSRRRIIEPQVFHAMVLEKQPPPLARFLAHLPRAFTASWTGLDWGPEAFRLAYLPRVRYRSTVLSPARWRLTSADLPATETEGLGRWRQRWRCPEAVELRDDDRTLRLTLSEPLHAAILRAHLDRHDEAILTEAAPVGAFGWIGDHAHEAAVPLVATGTPAPSPLPGRMPTLLNSSLGQGQGEALAAAEAVFAADSRAVVGALHHVHGPLLHPTALVAVGMVDIARGFLGHEAGMEWLAHRPTSPPTADRAVFEQAVRLARLRTPLDLPGWNGEVTDAWQDRTTALTRYRRQLPDDTSLDAILESLFHMHHNRMLGLDRPGRKDLSPRGTAGGPSLAGPPMTAAAIQQEQSLYSGAPGIALRHITDAQAGRGEWETVHAWGTAMVRHPVNADPDACGLFEGAPAVAYALHLADRPSYASALLMLDHHIATMTRLRLRAAHGRIDRGELPRLREYDLISGLTGLGVHLLARGGHEVLLLDLLRYLVRLTEPVAADRDLLPGWWTGDGPEHRPSPRWPGGHGNLGMAHGICGPLAFMAICVRRGLTVPRQAEAIRSICAMLDRWCLGTGERPWWPETLSRGEWDTRMPRRRHGPGRPSWCYGTPGIARARQLAALALGDAPLQHQAETALAVCVTDEQQLAQLTDASLCHGWSGLIRTVQRAAEDAGHGSPLDSSLPRLHARMHDYLEQAGQPRPGLMEGADGIYLTRLDAVNTAPTPRWDACLLLNG
ncbi:thiopeptide-type bacteriocin biosynthesis protein [Streptomyces sp. NPDC005790]|uniref:thiopeptide-type bacteriocin biosynthesis protein n=1 Tax=Streptomyces sp. NPDC005790 TaxID=3154777 RepID=UPI0033F6F959